MKRPINVTRIGPLQRSLLNFDVLDFIYREGNYGWNCDVTLDDYRIEPCKQGTHCSFMRRTRVGAAVSRCSVRVPILEARRQHQSA